MRLRGGEIAERWEIFHDGNRLTSGIIRCPANSDARANTREANAGALADYSESGDGVGVGASIRCDNLVAGVAIGIAVGEGVACAAIVPTRLRTLPRNSVEAIIRPTSSPKIRIVAGIEAMAIVNNKRTIDQNGMRISVTTTRSRSGGDCKLSMAEPFLGVRL